MGLFSRKNKNAAPGAVPASATVQPAMASQPAAPPAWNSTEFRVKLKMAKNRVEIQRGKKQNEIESTRRIIAQHLSTNKETLARIQAERVLRERAQVEALTIMETLIEELANSGAIFTSHTQFDNLPSHIKESTASVIFAAPRINAPELHTVVSMLRDHFTPAVVDPVQTLTGPHIQHINKILARLLDANAPDGYLVLEELTNIANEHNIDWIPPPEDHNLDSYGGYRPPPGGPGAYQPPGAGDMGGPGGMGGPGAGMGGGGGGGAPMNIPGQDPFPSPFPTGPVSIASGASDNVSEPTAPPAFDPAPHQPPTGDMYPHPNAHDPSGYPGGMPPYDPVPPHAPGHQNAHAPPPPPPDFTYRGGIADGGSSVDDDLSRRLKDMQDSSGPRR